MKLITTKDAAKRLNLSKPRIHQLINTGQLPAEQIGRDLLIKERYLEKFAAIERKTGRPPKKMPG